MFDSHAHLNFNTFKEDANEIIKDSLDRNIRIINIGSQYDTSVRAVKMAMDLPAQTGYETGVYASIGIHPIHLSQTEVEEEEIHFKSREERFDRGSYKMLLNKKVVAIGEIGLDYFHIPEGRDFEEIKAIQKEGFIEQLKFADDFDLPVILHCRGSKSDPYGAYNDMIDILRGFAVKWGNNLPFAPSSNRLSKKRHSEPRILRGEESPGARNGCCNAHFATGSFAPQSGAQDDAIAFRQPAKEGEDFLPFEGMVREGLRGVIHCFGGNFEIAKKFLEMGFYIGFTGIITFKNAGKELIEVAGKTPLDRILVETDCPYLAPVPHRGERCIPQYVEFTLRKVAELKGVSFEEAERITDGNVEKLFGIGN